MTKKFLLLSCYDGRSAPYEVNIICAGTKKGIIQYATTKFFKEIINKKLFSDGYCEISAEITIYIKPYKEGYCVVTAGPGCGDEFDWYDTEASALSKYDSIVDELQKNTDNELNYSISVYKIENNQCFKLKSDTAPLTF